MAACGKPGLLELLIRVLLTHPYGWPHVRRGAERELHELAGRLVAAGHEASVLTGRPVTDSKTTTRREVVLGAPVRRVRVPRLPGPEPGLGFGVAAWRAVARERPEVVHCLHYADAAGAARGPAPVVLKLTGVVRPGGARGLDSRLLGSALHRAAEVWVNSDWVVDAMAGFGVPMRVVPAGLDTTRFAPGPRAERPTVLWASSPAERHKRVEDLLAAWPLVRRQVPDAQLLMAGGRPPAVPDGARWVGPLDDEALAAQYARAWAVAMPSVHEALGLVTLEALASGTPVAGVRSGATPALLAAPGTGTLGAPLAPDDYAEALVAALQLGADPATAARCRAAAARYDWSVIVPEVLAGYSRVRAS